MIYFLIPAYNEARNLPHLLDSLLKWSEVRHHEVRLVVVDDGSKDATSEIVTAFKALPVTLVRHPVNRGVDRVFRTGFETAAQLGVGPGDLVVTIEADNTSSLEVLDKMVSEAEAGADLVLASCYAPGGNVVGVHFHRWILSWCANLLLRSIPKMPKVHTFSSFYRVYTGTLFTRMMAAYGPRLIEERGFVCVVEILLKCNRLGPRIAEVPMILDGAKRQGPSTLGVLKTIRGYLRLAARAFLGQVAKPAARAAGAEPVQNAAVARGAGGTTD